MKKKYGILPGSENQKEIELDGKKITVHRIIAKTTIPAATGISETEIVEEGTLGGWVEGEHNLSQFGQSWIAGDAIVCGKARVRGDGYVGGCAVVSGNAIIDEMAAVKDNARVSGMAELYGNCEIADSASVAGDTVLFGSPIVVADNARIEGKKEVSKKGATKRLLLKGNISVTGDSKVSGASTLVGDISIFGKSEIEKCYFDGKIDIWDSELSKVYLSGRYAVSENEKFSYFEKTRIPRKFFLRGKETMEETK